MALQTAPVGVTAAPTPRRPDLAPTPAEAPADVAVPATPTSAPALSPVNWAGRKPAVPARLARSARTAR